MRSKFEFSKTRCGASSTGPHSHRNNITFEAAAWQVEAPLWAAALTGTGSADSGFPVSVCQEILPVVSPCLWCSTWLQQFCFCYFMNKLPLLRVLHLFIYFSLISTEEGAVLSKRTSGCSSCHLLRISCSKNNPGNYFYHEI